MIANLQLRGEHACLAIECDHLWSWLVDKLLSNSSRLWCWHKLASLVMQWSCVQDFSIESQLGIEETLLEKFNGFTLHSGVYTVV